MLTRCKKTIALIALVAGCFHAGNSMALGLGELTVNSSLNQPLDASIQMLGLDGLTENQIQASLGTLADFNRANIARVGLIDDIQLEIAVFNAQEGILRLTSEEPVVEPFLNMVISVRWPNGRLMRDYTALIDLPVFISDEPQTVPVDIPETPPPEPPQQQEPRSQLLAEEEQPVIPRTEPVPAEATSVSEEPTVAVNEQSPQSASSQTSSQTAEDEVIIESGDTLYDIAAANRPSNNVSVEQTMLAIQRANPDAFIDGNINRIRVGRVLRIPALQEIQSIDQSQAVNQIALQNQAISAQPLAFNSNTGAGSQQDEDELTILSGDEGTPPSSDSDLAATIAALENQLAISEENLDRARLENQELQARFTDLEEQIEILQNIIAMQDTRLAQLQADLAAANQAEPEPAAAQAAAQPQPVSVQPAPQDNSLMGQLSTLFENTLVLVSSLVALIVLVVGFLVWRRRAAQDEMDDYALEGATVATGAQATYTADEPEGGFLAALKSRFSRSDDDDDDEVAVADNKGKADDVDDFDDEEEGGLLAKLKGIFSRSSDDDDDDFDDDDDDDDDEDDDDDDDEYDDEDDDDSGEEEDEDINVGTVVDAPEAEFDLDFDSDDDVDDDVDDEDEDETTVAFAEEDEDSDNDIDDDIDDDDLDLGNLGDLNIDEEESDDETAEKIVAEEDAPETFEFGLDDSDDADTGESVVEIEDEAADVESFDFSLDDTPAPVAEEPLAKKESGDLESLEFNVSKTPAIAESTEGDAENSDAVETFDFDVGSVSSFEEKASTGADSDTDEDVETFDFGLGSIDDDNDEAEGEVTVEVDDDDVDADPLAAALNEIDAEVEVTGAGEEGDDEFDLGDIEIDDTLFNADPADDSGAEPAGARDESSTKLDLAVAYEAMGDLDGAREILNEVVSEGNDAQIAEAKKLLEKWGQS